MIIPCSEFQVQFIQVAAADWALCYMSLDQCLHDKPAGTSLAQRVLATDVSHWETWSEFSETDTTSFTFGGLFVDWSLWLLRRKRPPSSHIFLTILLKKRWISNNWSSTFKIHVFWSSDCGLWCVNTLRRCWHVVCNDWWCGLILVAGGATLVGASRCLYDGVSRRL